MICGFGRRKLEDLLQVVLRGQTAEVVGQWDHLALDGVVESDYVVAACCLEESSCPFLGLRTLAEEVAALAQTEPDCSKVETGLEQGNE